MFTFIAFILTMLGCVNWLLVGLLQYDFIAGLFGFQASIFSRLCYILIGAGAMYLLLRVIINKGTFKVFEKRRKRRDASQTSQQALATANVEASKENLPQQDNNKPFDDEYSQPEHIDDALFDEHFNKN